MNDEVLCSYCGESMTFEEDGVVRTEIAMLLEDKRSSQKRQVCTMCVIKAFDKLFNKSPAVF